MTTQRKRHSTTMTIKVEMFWIEPDDFVDEHNKQNKVHDFRDDRDYMDDILARSLDEIGGYTPVSVELVTTDEEE